MVSRHKNFFVYAIIYVSLLVMLTAFFFYYFSLAKEELLLGKHSNSMDIALGIIINNMKNYLGYLIAFVFSPIYVVMDLIASAWNISVSLKAGGAVYTLRHLVFHGIIELPNAILYTYLSLRLFKKLIQQKGMRLKDYFSHLKQNKVYYGISLVLVVLAGLIEGLCS